MASDVKIVTLTPWNGSNYPMWKVQCLMALMKDGRWNIISGAETPPAQREGDKYSNFVIKRDRALAIIVMSIEPSLPYLIGNHLQQIEANGRLRLD